MQNSVSHISVYKASAGSGKTYALTKEYIRMLLAAPGNYKHILAVTFTNKACGEMKERILHTLYELSYNSSSIEYSTELCTEFDITPQKLQAQAKHILHEILHNYSFFYVETIDTFFQRIIRNFAKELGLHSYYGLELDTKTVIQNSIQDLFLHIHEHPHIQQWLIDYSYSKIDEGKSRNVFQALMTDSRILHNEAYMQLSDFELSFDKITEFFSQIEQNKKEFEQQIQAIAKQIVDIITKHGLHKENFSGASRSCMNPVYSIAGGDIVDFEKRKLEKLLDADNWFTKSSNNKHLQADLQITTMPQLLQTIFDMYAGKQGALYRTAQLLISNKYSVGMLQAIQHAIDTYCKEHELFLISNTNLFLQKIIQDSDAPFVYEKIGCFIKHMMIDEFQDTSNMQWKNFLPLIKNAVSEGGSALVVGDVKQSIYRFRNGDWSLLHERLYNDFSNEIHKVSLQHNWRSREHVIQFNNTFFTLFAQGMQQAFLGKMIDDGVEQIPEHVQTTITSLYTDVAQHIPKRNNDGGYVQVQLIDDNKETKFVDQVLENLVRDVVGVLEHGYAPEDIVFLCRSKKDIRKIVECFNAKKQEYPQYANAFSIVTGEGLLLSQSDVVQFVITYLQWMENPNTNFYRILLCTIYARQQNKGTTCDLYTLQQFEERIGTNPHISKDLSLHQITDAIIHAFSFNTIVEELVYIVEFQHVVYSYAKNNSVSISQFIDWWNEHESTLYIKQEPKGYMRAMTIHKSKGLQFSVVCMPFVNWKFTYNDSYVICDTADSDFSDLPFAYMSYSKAMALSQFAPQYAYETMQYYIDNLNILYVACTRAVDALYMYIPNKSNIGTISHEMLPCLQLLQSNIPHIKGDETMVCLGSLPMKQGVTLAEHKVQTEYPIYIEKPALLPVPETLRFVDRINSRRHEQIHGLRMHRLFEFIVNRHDIPMAVQHAIAEGIIEPHDADAYSQYCEHAIQQSKVEHWFNPNYRTLTEQGILTPQGEKRPDRIVFTSPTSVEIIDYKFTADQEKKHIQQVQEYVSLLEIMGYAATGFVWYVLQNSVVAVAE